MDSTIILLLAVIVLFFPFSIIMGLLVFSIKKIYDIENMFKIPRSPRVPSKEDVPEIDEDMSDEEKIKQGLMGVYFNEDEDLWEKEQRELHSEEESLQDAGQKHARNLFNGTSGIDNKNNLSVSHRLDSLKGTTDEA